MKKIAFKLGYLMKKIEHGMRIKVRVFSYLFAESLFGTALSIMVFSVVGAVLGFFASQHEQNLGITFFMSIYLSLCFSYTSFVYTEFFSHLSRLKELSKQRHREKIVLRSRGIYMGNLALSYVWLIFAIALLAESSSLRDAIASGPIAVMIVFLSLLCIFTLFAIVKLCNESLEETKLVYNHKNVM